MQYLMVLNDGETFTNLEGCFIAAVDDDLSIEEAEEILDDLELYGLDPLHPDGHVVATLDVVDEIPTIRVYDTIAREDGAQ